MAALDTAWLPDGYHTLAVRVEDAAGNQATVLGARSILVRNGPYSTSPPLLTGPAKEGNAITTDRGAWDGEQVSYGIGWQRQVDGAWLDIPGAAAATYALTAADVGHAVRSKVTATNPWGTAVAYSSPTAAVEAAMPSQPAPPPAAPPAPPPAAPPAPAPAPAPTPPAVGPPAPPPPSEPPNGVNGGADSRLVVAFAGTANRSLTVGYGQRVIITGRLTTSSGEAVRRASITVQTRTAATNASWADAARVTTDESGAFRWSLPAGPSRLVRFGYRAHAHDREPSQTSDLTVRVIPAVKLQATPRALRNGQTVTFRGSIAGAPSGSRKLVELQVRRGRSWMTFATTRLARGRFTYRYRFTRTYSAQTYPFRARVPTEDAWPFLTGQSSVVNVKVRR